MMPTTLLWSVSADPSTMGFVGHSGAVGRIGDGFLGFLCGEPLKAFRPWPDARTGNPTASMAIDMGRFFGRTRHPHVFP